MVVNRLRRHTGGGEVAGLVMWCGNWLAGS